jgi:rSAM/selenodomain-associated transferase 1
VTAEGGSGRILVLAKAPHPGRSKTRLCPPCTPEQAATVAEAALRDTLDAVARASVSRRILVLDGAPGPWVPGGFELIGQRGKGLDERIAAAFEDGGAPALLIGMDTPQVTAFLLEEALAELHRPGVDAVLGPAMDGGWWAIGLRRPAPAAFLGLPMSTGYTGAAQTRRLERLGLRWSALPALRDVDVFEDALAVAEVAPRSGFARAVRLIGASTLVAPSRAEH